MAKTTRKTAAKAAEPTQKKAAAKKAPAKKTVAKKKTATRKKAAVKKATSVKSAARKTLTIAERDQMISEAAYLRGEAQGFLSDEREDWLLAEAEVNTRLEKAGIKLTG